MTVRVPWMLAPDGPKRLDNVNALDLTAHAVRLNPNSRSVGFERD